jgi:hypothetical protein
MAKAIADADATTAKINKSIVSSHCVSELSFALPMHRRCTEQNHIVYKSAGNRQSWTPATFYHHIAQEIALPIIQPSDSQRKTDLIFLELTREKSCVGRPSGQI